MKNKKNLLSQVDSLFDNVPLDDTLNSVRTKVLNFLETEIVDFEGLPEETKKQEKFILIEFE